MEGPRPVGVFVGLVNCFYLKVLGGAVIFVPEWEEMRSFLLGAEI